LETLKQERASTTIRIKGLLSSQGLRVTSLTHLPEQLDALRLWDSSPIPPGLRRRVRAPTWKKMQSVFVALYTLESKMGLAPV
jgi:hypothetical protein